MEHIVDLVDARTRLIVTDGVFSMDGNVAPLPEILALARQYDAATFIDECHATGTWKRINWYVHLYVKKKKNWYVHWYVKKQ